MTLINSVNNVCVNNLPTLVYIRCVYIQFVKCDMIVLVVNVLWNGISYYADSW